MNAIIEKIRAEVEELKIETPLGPEADGYNMAITDVLSVLSDLEKEEKPMNPDDAMKELDEKIALVKQRRTWDGVDVDKYMDEVRGREPEKPMELDFEQALYKHFGQVKDFTLGLQIAKHFYELGRQSKPKVCEGLEEEISRYLREDCSDDDEPSISDVARHFAQWGAEHLDK